MNNWLDRLKKQRIFSPNEYPDPRMDRDMKFVNKVLPKIVESDLLEFLRRPVIKQYNFNFLVPVDRLNESMLQSPCMLLKDWEGRVVYMEYLDINGGYNCLAQHEHHTAYGNLYEYEIQCWKRGISGPITYEKWGSTFNEKILPKYLLENWGIENTSRVYILIKEKIKDEIKNIIEHNMYNGFTSYNYGRSEVRQMWERSNGGLREWKHPN